MSLVAKEMQIEITIRYYFTYVRMARVRLGGAGRNQRPHTQLAQVHIASGATLSENSLR
jgi:hypothetical protein